MPTPYETSYAIRYTIPKLQQQTEVAVIDSADDIINEAADAPNHANRLAWAQWAIPNSSVAKIPFMWPVASNPTIIGQVQEDPTGNLTQDADIQFIVNSSLGNVIAAFIANPPPKTPVV